MADNNLIDIKNKLKSKKVKDHLLNGGVLYITVKDENGDMKQLKLFVEDD